MGAWGEVAGDKVSEINGAENDRLQSLDLDLELIFGSTKLANILEPRSDMSRAVLSMHHSGSIIGRE